MADRFQWLTTEQNPNVKQYGVDQGQRGWRTHAVEATATQTLESVRYVKAACGLLPRHGWGMDLFVDRPCARCLVKVGEACSVCHGRGTTGAIARGDWETCKGCVGKGTKAAQEALARLREQMARRATGDAR